MTYLTTHGAFSANEIRHYGGVVVRDNMGNWRIDFPQITTDPKPKYQPVRSWDN